MRLTNVAQMELAHGRVSSYGVQARPGVGTALPVSFDQALHVGAGQRPGSWMAIAFRLGGERPSREELAAAWDGVVARHGTLRTAFSKGSDGAVQLHEIAVEPGRWADHPVPGDRRTREVLRDVLDLRCAPYERPSHRLCLVEPPPEAPDPRPEIVIGADHAHVDMWSLVILARDLLDALEDVRAGRPPNATAPPVPGFAEHTAVLEAMPAAPPAIVDRWDAILAAGGGVLPVFPLPLGRLDPRPTEVVEVRDVLGPQGTARLTAIAREQGVRLIALGLSVLTEITLRRSGRPLRAVFPVHSRHEPHWREASGWFITNAVLEATDPDPKACVAAVEEATGLGSWPLAPIFAARGPMPPVPGLFAVSWLDARRLPVPAATATDLRYVSAAIRTDGVMVWFVINDAGLHLRCRYPDTPEARANVGGWLDDVDLGLRALAARELTT